LAVDPTQGLVHARQVLCVWAISPDHKLFSLKHNMKKCNVIVEQLEFYTEYDLIIAKIEK
jgi:hypothetical protein